MNSAWLSAPQYRLGSFEEHSPFFFSTRASRIWSVCALYSHVIDTDEKLAGFLPRLHQAEWIAVDTEADSLHAYPEKLCLLQISIEGADELFDPLSRMEWTPGVELLGR